MSINVDKTLIVAPLLLPLADSLSCCVSVWRPSLDFCCSDTNYHAASRPRPPPPPIGRFGHNCSPVEASDWLSRAANLFGFLLPASRAALSTQCVTLRSLYLGVNTHCRRVGTSHSDLQYLYRHRQSKTHESFVAFVFLMTGEAIRAVNMSKQFVETLQWN